MKADNIARSEGYIMYEYGKGVRMNDQKALDLYGKACNMGYGKGCKAHERLKNQQ
ncbi:MAG: Sel1 repeat protein [Campylobacterota bacterium]|nr:Sel1 repeat protein [Campylobacterota bacterium]